MLHLEFSLILMNWWLCVVSEEVLQMQIDEIEADISVGTEIPDHEPIEDFQSEEVPASCLSITEDPSTGNANYHAYDDHGNP